MVIFRLALLTVLPSRKLHKIIEISGKDIKPFFDTSKPEGDKARCADYSKAKEIWIGSLLFLWKRVFVNPTIGLKSRLRVNKYKLFFLRVIRGCGGRTYE